MRTLLTATSALNVLAAYVNYGTSQPRVLVSLLFAGICLGLALKPASEKKLPWDGPGPTGGVA